MKKNFFHYLPLVLIIVLGIFLRTVFLNTSPPALNEDEAALGYNAFSILKTGADEHGKFLPLALESFGDWKLPVYSYADVLFVALFGLSELSVRLPSILSGVLGIILIYLIVKKLFGKETISLFASFFFSVSPWSIFFSRAAYEVNLGTTVFLVGVFLFLKGLDKGSFKKIFLFFSGICFGIPLLTYHAYIVFTPLFICILMLCYRKVLRWNMLYLIIPFLFFIFLSLLSTYTGGQSKFSTTTIFNNKNIIYNRVENFKKDTLLNPPLIEKIHTKYLGVSYQILQNYVNSFSPTFLFDRGGEKLVHNLDGFGNIYLIDGFLLFAGIAGLFFNKEKNIRFLLIWLVFAPLPSSLTIDAPNSTRLFILMPLFVILSSYGAWFLFVHLFKTTYGKIIFVIVSCTFLVNVIFFLDLYFIHFGYHRAKFWHYGYKEAVSLAQSKPNSPILMKGPENFPYIYFLFYNKYDPLQFRREVMYYPTTDEGFKYVKKFGRYTFVDKLQGIQEASGTLYIDDQNFNQEDTTIKLPNGDPIFKYYMGNEKKLQ